MKDFNYNGHGTLSFTHQNQDFVIHENGPHKLPEESELVISLVNQELLTEVQVVKLETLKEVEVKTQKISTNKTNKQ